MNVAKIKVMLCFYKGNISNDISILEQLDKNGFEVHLFNDIYESNLKCDILLDIIKDLFGKEKDKYSIYVSSNVKEFIMLQYILYRDWISGALYLNNNLVHLELEELYKKILNEELHKNTSNFYIAKKEESIFNNYCIFNGDFQLSTNSNEFENTVYKHKGITHVFSIRNSENIKVVSLDSIEDTKIYKYHLDLQYLDKYMDLIETYSSSTEKFRRSYESVSLEFNIFKDKILNSLNFEINVAKVKLDNELYRGCHTDKYKILLSSVLLHIFNDNKYLEFLLNLLTESTSIDKYNRFFAYNQCVRYIFLNKNFSDEKTGRMIEKLYEKIFTEFSTINKKYVKVPKEQRKDNVVFIITSQFLSINHAPSKIAIDTCYNLMKGLNKNVILINTKELLSLKGILPIINIETGSKRDGNYGQIDYKDINIPFYQPQCTMPDDSEIIKILNMVEEYKPSLIINIGTCLVGDLCSNIVPTLTIPLISNGYAMSTFYLVNNKKHYEEYTKKHNRNTESLIISEFAFELKSKKHTFTKVQLGIPKNKFIISVVGNRLNDEIDEEFLNILEKVCTHNNAYILFVSKFNFKDGNINKYSNLISNHKNMGYQEDLLAVLENIDLYVNPKRIGGGTSAIYAIYLGKPVVTLNYGDVAVNVGKEFCVDNYNEMFNKISEYCSNSEFYNKQSSVAKERALDRTNMSQYINDIYGKARKNILY